MSPPPPHGSNLARYAARFAAVEINSSFYRPHRPETYARWADSVPAGFRFAVKLPKSITHEKRLQEFGAELDRFAAEVGVQLSDTPKHLVSIWGTKTFILGDETDLRVGGGVRHVGSTISTGFAFGGTLRTPSYTLADALLALDWKQWSLSVSATNLFDRDYFAPCRAFGDCFTGNGRSVIGTLAYRF